MLEPSATRIRSLLARSYLFTNVELVVNAFLVNTGTKLILIDTGTGTSKMFRLFPNAIVRADVRETDHYLNRSKMEAAPADDKEDFESAMAMFKPYVTANRFKSFDGETQLVAGVRAVPARGHTPGHMIYVVESGKEKLVVWGDLMHVAAVEFAQPSVTVPYDFDAKKAAQERRYKFADAAKQGYYVAAAHVAFPGIGKLRAEGQGVAWVPIGYIVGK